MLAFLIAATLQVGAGSTAEFPVTFRQDDARWPVVVNATGVVTQDGDGLRVRLGSVQVADQPANPSTIPYTTTASAWRARPPTRHGSLPAARTR